MIAPFDAAFLRSILSYDPLSGLFTWLPRPSAPHCWNKTWAGKRAGNVGSEGYLQISVRNRLYKAHRLAWLHVTGEWPHAEIDHRNGDAADNRFANLRAATRHENARNRGAQSNSLTGMRGVSYRPRSGRWAARIKVAGLDQHLGCFDSAEQAQAAYRAAQIRHFGEFARIETGGQTP